jgi:hypothetical protein
MLPARIYVPGKYSLKRVAHAPGTPAFPKI